MTKFENRFFKLLEQDLGDELGVASVDPTADRETFEGSFENPGDVDKFATDPRIAGFQQKYVEKAKAWLTKIAEFSEWLNSPDGDSLNKQLIAMDRPNSPFEGISAEAKKITSVAEDLARLSETLKGVILSADKKQRDISAQQNQLGM